MMVNVYPLPIVLINLVSLGVSDRNGGGSGGVKKGRGVSPNTAVTATATALASTAAAASAAAGTVSKHLEHISGWMIAYLSLLSKRPIYTFQSEDIRVQ